MKKSELIAALEAWPESEVQIRCDPHFNGNGIGWSIASDIAKVTAVADSTGGGVIIIVPTTDLFTVQCGGQ